MFKLLFLIFLLNVSKLKAIDDDQKAHEVNCTATKDEFMTDPWINNLDTNGNVFSSNIEIVDLEKQSINLIEEIFDFKFDIGEFKFQHRFTTDKESIIEYVKYFKNIAYLSSNKTFKCVKCEKNSSDARKYQIEWMPKEIISDNQVSYNRILSPSAMLLHFRDKMDSTHQYKYIDENELIRGFAANLCIAKKTYMLRFIQVKDTSVNKNFIKKIQILKLEKNGDKEVYVVKKQFNYYHIEIITDENRHLGENLPIGLGCQRDENDEKGKNFKNPQINNQQYELDFQFIQNQIKSSVNQMKYFDPAFTVVGHHKLYFDDAHRLSVNFGPSPISDETIKSIHDYSIRTIFDINLSTGYCVNRLEPKSDSFVEVNFNDPLSILKNIPEVLRLQEKNNVYIGTFITRNIACEVYETSISRKINDETQTLIITHYYPSLNFQPENSKLPIRIDVRQYSNPDLIEQDGYFIFLINKFHPNLDFARQEIFDISNCMTNHYEYNWFLIEFDCSSSDIENLKKTQLAMLDAFRSQLAINPIRIPKIIIDFDDNTVYFTTKLLDVPAIQNHFDQKIKEKLKTNSKQFLTDDERNCAKTCYNNPDCVSYSFCSNQICSLLYLKNYGSDDKMQIPDGYIKSVHDENCSLKKRIYKLKKDDIGSRDIRSVMSNLKDKIKSGDFVLDVKINNDEKVRLKPSEIILNVEPGSKQSNYLEEERDLLRGTSANYDQYFSVFNSNSIFDYDKLTKQKATLNIKHSNLGLADCQLQCINNLDCNSFSYCDNKLCIVTSLFDEGSINSNVKSSPNCVISRKNYLASYSVHENRGVKNLAKEKFVLEKAEDQNEETCAKLCSTQTKYDCLSFEYCDGQLKGKPDKEKICLFHELNLQSEKEQKLEWEFSKSHCDHYNKKHSTNYKEYGMQEFVNYDLVEYTTLPLENCAKNCDEHGSCNSFDYCIEETNKGDFEKIRCRLHTDTYNIKNANTKSPKCSIYTSLKPKIPLKKVIYKERTFTKGLTVLLSFLSLLAGSSIGVLLSFLCIRKFFKEDEEDDF